MRAFFSSLLCASLLIHAVLGCCCHDIHDAAADGGTLASLTAVDCCHDHDGPHGPHTPCKGHPNCHGLCHYLPVQKPNFDKCLGHVVIDFSSDAYATTGSQVFASSIAPGSCEFCGPPVRLHLFHQILLI
jgi:hypothetical protein